MKVIWEPEEQGIILKAVHPTKYTTGQIADKLVNIYMANLHDDIAWVLEMLEEDENDTKEV